MNLCNAVSRRFMYFNTIFEGILIKNETADNPNTIICIITLNALEIHKNYIA